MAHVRPFWTSTLQDFSNGINNALMQGVLTPTIALLIFRSPRGFSSPIFGSVSGNLTLPSKWGCDTSYFSAQEGSVAPRMSTTRQVIQTDGLASGSSPITKVRRARVVMP
jgi:hypothetical protein